VRELGFREVPKVDAVSARVLVAARETRDDRGAPTLGEAQPWPCRQDPFSTNRAAFKIRTCRLCRRTLMFHQMAELGARRRAWSPRPS